MSERLLDLSAEAIIGYIADAAWRWCNPDYPPRVRTTRRLVERTGYAVPAIEFAIDRLMSGLTRDAMRHTIENELGGLAALDTFVERAGRPRLAAQPRGRVVIISSRTTIGVAIPAAAYALATKNTVVVKDREDGLVREFFATLAQEHDAFAQTAIAHQWSSDAPARLDDADVVVAFGSDETLQTIRASLPATTEFVGFGSRISCGLIGVKTPAMQHVLSQAARDIVLYEGEGCMSLHVLFVMTRNADEDALLGPLAHRLAQAMSDATIEFPLGEQSETARHATAAVRATQQFRAAMGMAIGAQVGPASVCIDRDLPPPMRPLTTLIVPVRDETEVAAYLKRHTLRVETLAVECADHKSIALSRMIGAHRITTFGAMQNPDLAGDHGGRSRTLDFVQLIDLEPTEARMPTPSGQPQHDDAFESIRTAIPGPRSLELAELLARYESQGVTYLAEDFPVFWKQAAGVLVTDADDNRYIDCSSAFGVAAVGHANPRVVAAITRQAQRLLHGMGDVHPSDVRAHYLKRLSAVAPGDLSRCFLGSNGADAVEFALKTAYLKTGRPGVVAFEGGYHGLSYGTLEIAGIERFRTPFQGQLRNANPILPYPTERRGVEIALAEFEACVAARSDIGAVVIEPIAGRAGTLVPAAGYLAGLRKLADRYGLVLIFDEIYTGFGRTGTWFACEHEGVLPDVICVGKAIAGGFPLSAAIGTDAVFSAWPRSSGEAIHTSTFLGNPVACAAGLAVLEEIESHDLITRAAEVGSWLGTRLAKLAHRLEERIGSGIEVRGRGMMWALDLGDASLAVGATIAALHAGLIVLPQGMHSTAIALTPPLVIEKTQLTRALTLLEEAVLTAYRQRQKEIA